MTRALRLASVLILCCLGTFAHADSLYEAGKLRWLATDYPPAYDKLGEFRREPFGRRPEVDYMLGTSGCRMTGKEEWGARVLRYTLYNYPLVDGSRALVRRELALCQAATSPLGPMTANAQMVDSFVAAGASGSGKMWAPADRVNPVLTYPARHVRALPAQELELRRVPLGQPEKATAMVRKLAPNLRSVAVTERFVLASSANHTANELRQIGEHLTRYLGFLGRVYDIDLPDRYIAIYLVPSMGELRKLALSLHGLDMGANSPIIGYTYRDDESAVAVIVGTGTGTLFHELFHLSAHRQFGDIPQWLDEGIASLYEVSAFYGDTLLGEPNWRGKVIQKASTPQPTVEEVVTSNWFPFDVQELRNDADGVGRATMELSLQMAINRYFILYLQERGLLPTVYAAFRDRDIRNSADDPAVDAIRRLEAATGEPLITLEGEFIPWLNRVLQSGIRRDRVPDLRVRKYEPPLQDLEPLGESESPKPAPPRP